MPYSNQGSIKSPPGKITGNHKKKDSPAPVRIGVSSCLLGEKVRYNGDHKKNKYVCEVLGKHFEWIPICPEVEAGMGIPREPVKLFGTKEDARINGEKTGTDWTRRMTKTAEKQIRKMQQLDVRGFVLKKNSPSCGTGGIPVYKKNGEIADYGPGLFVQLLLNRLPDIPVVEENQLQNKKNRENFINGVFAYRFL